MDLAGRSVALYGRFTPGRRDELRTEIVARGGLVARDLTRRSHLMVVGALATTLLDSGALPARLSLARSRGVPVRGEYRFAGALLGEDPPQATLPITQSGLSIADADALNAFDIIALEADRCRFGDVTVMRTAQDLLQQGRSIAETVQIMRNVRTRAPKGRHKVVLTAHGAPALQWEDGLTDLDGQTLLPLADEGHASVDDLFDAAAIAEAEGERETALRLYDLCARADRTDPIAVYNIGNIRLSEGDHRAAILAYRRALARDPRFSEARYNLAQALEGAGDMRAAQTELERLVVSEPKQADAIFNLAQINMKIERFREAKTLFQRFLLLEPSADWRAKARKAIQYCLSRSPS